MIIDNSNHSDYIKNQFLSATTLESDFIPVYNMNIGQEELVSNNYDYNFYIYHKLGNFKNHFPDYNHVAVYNHVAFMDAFNYKSYNVSGFKLRNSSGEVTRIFVNSKYVMDENLNILILLSLKKEFLGFFTETTITIDKDNADKFTLFLSTELFNNPNYMIFYKKMLKEFIEYFYEIGLEVRILSSDKIEELNYKNSFNMNFNRLDELTNHLNNDVHNLLFHDEDAIIPAGLNIPLSSRNSIYVPEQPIQEMDSIPHDNLDCILYENVTVPYEIVLVDDTLDY